MDIETHNRYFRDIAYNTDPSVSWRQKQEVTGRALFEDVILKKHEEDLVDKFSKCIHASSVRDVVNAPRKSSIIFNSDKNSIILKIIMYECF